MGKITLVHKAFDKNVPREYSEYYLLYILEAVCRANMKWLELFPQTPNLYESGVYYVPEDGTEEWPDVQSLYERGCGDCEDLACARVAELRIRHRVKCRPFIRWRETKEGHRTYHVLVAIKNPRGNTIINGERYIIEDPSKRLGMNGDM